MATAVETPQAVDAVDASHETHEPLSISGLSEVQSLIFQAMLVSSPDGISVQSNHLYEPVPEMLTLTVENAEQAVASLSAKQREIVIRRLNQLLPNS